MSDTTCNVGKVFYVLVAPTNLCSVFFSGKDLGRHSDTLQNTSGSIADLVEKYALL